MTSYSHDRYAQLVTETVEQINLLSKLKGGEYAGDVDRLANFRRNAADMDLTMEQVWRVYAGKHWDAITQYVKDVSTGKERQRLESISGRLDDLIVYAILMKAMVDERSGVPHHKHTEIQDGDRMALTLKDVAIPRQTILPDAEERN